MTSAVLRPRRLSSVTISVSVSISIPTSSSILPTLAISQQNLNYYASLVHFYTLYDLRRLKPEQTYLYLLCFAWLRYRQLTDNLVDALSYRMKRLEDDTKHRTHSLYVQQQLNQRQQETPKIGRLLLLYVDEKLADTLAFGKVRQQAFAIMSKDALQIAGKFWSWIHKEMRQGYRRTATNSG